MFEVVLGQDGDDYVGGSAKDLMSATQIANGFAEQLNRRPIGKQTTYIYILTPSGERINVPYKTLTN